MFTQTATMTWRTLRRQTLNSLINIGGLAVGLAAVLLILIFARYEMGYDEWVPQGERVYGMSAILNLPGAPPRELNSAPAIILPHIRENVVGVDTALGFYGGNWSVSVGSNVFLLSMALTDAPIFDIFPRPLISGTADILDDPNAVLLSKSQAERLFGRSDIVGETITVDAAHSLKVAGVYEDFPEQGHVTLDAIAPLKSVVAGEGPLTTRRWGSISAPLYVKLKDGFDSTVVLGEIQDQFTRNAPERWIEQTEGTDLPPFMQFRLTPLRDLHLEGMSGQWRPSGDGDSLNILLAVAAVTLIMATINSVNLTTARLLARSHEVALRQTLGARPGQLVGQLLGETCLLAMISLVVALVGCELFIPQFANLMDRPLTMGLLWNDLVLLSAMVILTLAIGCANAALALYRLLRRRPAMVLRGGRAPGFSTRSILLIVQFATALLLAIAAIVIEAQVEFSRQRDLGFDADHLIALGRLHKIGDTDAKQSLMRAVAQVPGVVHTGLVDNFPGAGDRSETGITVGDKEFDRLETINAEASGLIALNPRLVAGRLLDPALDSDILKPAEEGQDAGGSIVVSRSLARALGVEKPEDLLGQYASIASDLERERLTIVGIIEDIQMRGLDEPLPAMGIYFDPRNAGNALAIRLEPGREVETIERVRALWTERYPQIDININYVDDMMEGLTRTEARLATLIQLASALAIAIAAAGLFAFSSLSVAKRTKEIGVRKVVGARSSDITRLILLQFSRPVLIAAVLATPLAWYLLNSWLKGFAYRIDLTPTPFLMGALAALAIAWATVGSHAWRASRTHPVNAIRHE